MGSSCGIGDEIRFYRPSASSAKPSALCEWSEKPDHSGHGVSRRNTTEECSELFLPREPFTALLAVSAQSVLDDRISVGRGANLIDFHRLAFQLLVVLKEAAQHQQAVRRHFLGVEVAVELRVFGGDGNDLVVLLAGINHGHQPNGTRANHGK